MRQARYRACFFLRFYHDSLITEKAYFLPETSRSALLAELAAGRGLAHPYRFTRRLSTSGSRDSLVGLVSFILDTNERNLRMGRGYPPYPPDLGHLARVEDVTVVPALLVLLRKCLGSAFGFAEWQDVDDRVSIWN